MKQFRIKSGVADERKTLRMTVKSESRSDAFLSFLLAAADTLGPNGKLDGELEIEEV